MKPRFDQKTKEKLDFKNTQKGIKSTLQDPLFTKATKNSRYAFILIFSAMASYYSYKVIVHNFPNFSYNKIYRPLFNSLYSKYLPQVFFLIVHQNSIQIFVKM